MGRRLDWVGGRGYGERDGDGRRYLLATTAFYDSPRPHWMAFVLQEPLAGRFETQAEAEAAAEQAVIDAGL
jgi:hypothetical protein